ncbi:MAG: carbohydrate-binding protein [Fibrobacter sp.]|nr:carbohydrate-binding protein [Fibrobacter sp.]
MNCFTKLWHSAVIASMVIAPLAWAKVTIYMCGDSTMQDWAEGYCPKQGQGQDFHYWFDENKAAVVNRGQGGMAAEGYYDMFWKHGCSAGNCIVDKLQKGDYVVIQFGINDVNKSSTEGFVSSMTAMVEESQAKGAYPIIMSPIRRMWFDSPTQVHASYRQYPEEARKLAESLDVPFIDMFKWVANYMVSVGELYTMQFVFNYSSTSEYSNLRSDEADATHLQMNGANAFGRIITEQMRAHQDVMVKKLGDYMAPMYQVDVKVSPEGSAEATSINAYYPQGMTVLLKTIPKSGKKFLGWYDGNGNKVSGNVVASVKSPYIHTFRMGNAATQYTAVYEGGTAQKYTGDGKALTSFPMETPTSLSDVTFVPFTPMEGTKETEEQMDKNIKKFFDAYMPDTGIGTSDTNWAHTGLGFFNVANEMNSFASYKMKFPGAGNVTLAVRYANGGNSNRTFNAYLDHDYIVNAPPTGGWENWDTAYVVIDAPFGEVELKFISLTSDGAPNIDAFGFSIDGVCRVSEGCADTIETIALPTSVAAAGAKLRGGMLTLSHDADVSVFDMRGRLVVRKSVSAGEVDLSSLVRTNGLYRVIVRDGISKFVATYAKVR